MNIKLTLTIILLILKSFIFSQNKYAVESILQKGHLKHITCSEFSPDNNLLITGSIDHTIILWDVSTGKEIRSFCGHSGSIKTVCFNNTGEQILSTGSDNQAIIFETLTGEIKHLFKLEKEELINAFYGNQNNVYLVNKRYDIFRYRLDSLQEKKTFKKNYGHNTSERVISPIDNRILCYENYKSVYTQSTINQDTILKISFNKANSMEYSTNGKYIAIGSTKLFAKVFDSETGKELFEFKDPENRCDGCNTIVRFSKTSKYLATGAKTWGIQLFSLKTGKNIISFPNIDDRINYIKFDEKDRYFIAGTDDELWVFDIKNKKMILHIENIEVDYYKPAINTKLNAFTLPDKYNSTKLVSIKFGKKIKNYKGYLNQENLSGLKYNYQNWTHRGILRYLGRKSNIAISNNGKYLVKGQIDTVAIMIDIETGKKVKTFTGHKQAVLCFDFHPSKNILITGSGDNTLKLWNTETGRIIKTLKGHRALIFDVDFSSDGKKIISASWDGSCRIWDTNTGKELLYVDFKNNSPYTVKFTPNNLYFIASDLAGNVTMRDSDTGEIFRKLIGHQDIVASIDFSKNGKELFTAGWDGLLKVRNLASGMLTKRFNDHPGGVFAVACSPNNKYIASAGNDKNIVLRDYKSGEILKILHAQTAGTASLSFTPDEKLLISSDIDGTIKVWDLETKTELYSLIYIDRNNYLSKTPGGYFDGTSTAGKNINYISGNKALPANNFFEKYYTPNLVKRIMSGEKVDISGQNINTLINEDTPQINISLNKFSSNTETDTIFFSNKDLSLTLNLINKNKIEEIRIYNNGKLIISDLIHKTPVFRGGPVNNKNYDINLNNGLNKIKAIAIDKNRTESLPDKVNIFYSGKTQVSNLYILSIGINKYQNPDYQLNYAVNDAKAYAKSVEKGASILFNKTIEYFIKDEKSGKESILSIISEIADKIEPQDVFLFYYAGHGAMNSSANQEEKDFFLIPYNITNLYGDYETMKLKGIAAKELMEISEKISAQKQLFIIDACQSGGAVNTFAKRGLEREKAIAQLARSTGTFFLTASQDMQYANEAGILKHGIFTYAILEGLKGNADGGSKDQKITVNELKSYVGDKVPELSKKYSGTAQYPTSYGYGQDFPIVISKLK